MSIYKHEAVIVTTSGNDVNAIVAFRDRMPTDLQECLVGPVYRANHFYSFALMPHGSGNGYTVSANMETIIAPFINLLDNLDNVEWAHIVLFDEAVLNAGGDPSPYVQASSGYEFDGEHWRKAKCRRNISLQTEGF